MNCVIHTVVPKPGTDSVPPPKNQHRVFAEDDEGPLPPVCLVTPTQRPGPGSPPWEAFVTQGLAVAPPLRPQHPARPPAQPGLHSGDGQAPPQPQTPAGWALSGSSLSSPDEHAVLNKRVLPFLTCTHWHLSIPGSHT